MMKNLIFGWHQILKYYGHMSKRSDQSAATKAQRPKRSDQSAGLNRGKII
jgi:hypothetical protein